MISPSHFRRFSLAAALALAFIAAAPRQVFADASDLEKRLVVRKLANGLTVIVYPRPSAPVFSAIIAARVGSVDEPAGQTGVAHMMEHMAFKGTRHIGTVDFDAEFPALHRVWETGAELTRLKAAVGNGANGLKKEDVAERIAELEKLLKERQLEHRALIQRAEIDRLYSINGGVGMNASTSPDFTTYYIDLPANKLELWALIESQRFAEPILREFYIERDVVAEERRTRTDSNPFGKAYEALMAMTFIAHPYRNPTIGWMSDIQSLTKEKAETFFRERYTPNNLAIAIVGGVDPEETIDMVDRYFGRLKAADPAKKSEAAVTTIEPEQIGERRSVIQMPGSPAVAIAFRKKTLPTREDLVVDVIQTILAEGDSSRLIRRLVKEEEVAAAAASFVGPGHRYDNAIIFYAVPRAPHTTADCERLLYEELERLGRERVGDAELKKAITKLKGEAARGMRDNQDLAILLAYSELGSGDPLYSIKALEELDTVTPAEIQQVAKRLFAPSRRNVVVLEPAPGLGSLLGSLLGGGQ
jgi:predicted Zn-dependent peptidase